MEHAGIRRKRRFIIALAGGILAVAIASYDPSRVSAQSLATATPEFEVASIKPCKDGPSEVGVSVTPGRLDLNCQTVGGLLQLAFVVYANGHLNPPWSRPAFEGGPAWMDSERFTISAKGEGNASRAMMNGPMLQALLKSRFKLQIHSETRMVPVYELRVAKNGPKLQAFNEGTCVPLDFSASPAPSKEGQKNCLVLLGGGSSQLVTVAAQGMTLDEFCKVFLGRLDRPILNKTGISGLFDFRVEYANETVLPVGDGSNAGDTAARPSIFTAFEQQLGLKLVSGKGPAEFYVIDHVERPTEN
jgi:uncharacterized protein (TIGR03435 family)